MCTIIPPAFSDEKKSLEIETENEISTFLALISVIVKLRLSKLCGPIISTYLGSKTPVFGVHLTWAAGGES